MMQGFLNAMNGDYIAMMPFPWWVLALMVIWTLPWKGVALWKSAKNRQISWFVVLLVVNTLAILEIIYLAFFQKKNKCCEKENENNSN